MIQLARFEVGTCRYCCDFISHDCPMTNARKGVTFSMDQTITRVAYEIFKARVAFAGGKQVTRFQFEIVHRIASRYVRVIALMFQV